MATSASDPYAGTTLGRAIEHACSADFQDDFDWDFVSPDGLSTREAWELATQWVAQLRGHTGFCVDKSNALFSIAPRMEWLFVCLYCGLDDAIFQRAKAARAMVLTWRALAACRSFSLEENKGFWRRVAWKLHDRTGLSTMCMQRADNFGRDVTDDCWFFDGVVFPRVKLQLPRDVDDNRLHERVAHAFLGLIDAEEDFDERSGWLKAALTRLARVSNSPPAPVPPIEVMLTEFGSVDYGSFIDFVAKVRMGSDFEITCVQSADVVSDWHGQSLPVAIVYHSVYSIKNEHEFEQRMELRDRLLRLMLHPGDITSGLRHLRMCHSGHDRETEFAFEALCSILPHVHTLDTFEIEENLHYARNFSARSSAWLGYAMFHPDTVTSPWKRLAFGETRFCIHTTPVEVWETMAKGNNLQQYLDDDDSFTQVDAYYTATIREGATIYYKKPVITERVVEVLDADTAMDVLVTSTSMADLEEWTAVVSVGFGKAWVHSSEIIEITSRLPGRSSLSALRIELCHWDPLKLIELIGDGLTYLDITRCVQPGLGRLRKVWSSCPQLKSVAVQAYELDDPSELPLSLHELSLFTSHYNQAKTPHELRLLGPSLFALKNLRLLRVTMRYMPSDELVADLILPLVRALPRLQKFTYTKDIIGTNSLGYALRRYISRSVLCQHPGRDDVAVASEHAPSETLVALLSVIKRWSEREGGYSVDLGRDLVLHIGVFVGGTVQRDLWLDGYSNCTSPFGDEDY